MADLDARIDQHIAGVNDVAQTARTASLGLMFVIAVMLATVVGTSDEAVLRNTAKVVPQLGVQISVSLTYFLAPIAFLFLHVTVLLQIDLLDQQLKALNGTLNEEWTLAAADRNRHRQRLNSFVFVQLYAGGNNGCVINGLTRTLCWFSFVGIPLALMVAIQVGYVRAQFVTMTNIHRVFLVADVIAVLIVLFRSFKRHRGWLAGIRLNLNVLFMAGILGVSFLAAPPDDLADPPDFGSLPTKNQITDVRWSESPTYRNNPNSFAAQSLEPIVNWPNWQDWHAWHNPMDVLLCRQMVWGCRYLSVDKLALIREDAPVSAVQLILSDQREAEGSMKGTEARIRTVALSLKNRTLRYADFTSSVLYGADLANNDLRGASFDFAQMIGVRLDKAWLQGSSFYKAELLRASFKKAKLIDASLEEAKLSGAEFKDADINGTFLFGTDLSEVKHLTQTQLDLAYCDMKTIVAAGYSTALCRLNLRELEVQSRVR